MEAWRRRADAAAPAKFAAVSIAAAADERNHALVHIVKVDPRKALPTEIVKRRLLDVKLVEPLDIRLKFSVFAVFGERPVKLPS